jgi:hypothetical protein
MLALVLAACSDAALFGLIKSKSKAQAAVRQSLTIFPFDKDPDAAANVPEDFGQSVAEYLRTSLAASKGYAVLLYDDRLMPIVRAKSDNAVKEQDAKSPFFADKAKADKLADILCTDYYVVGSVESYTYDKDKKTVDLALKADLVLTRTGKVIQEFMVGGSASAGTQAMEEDELCSIAAGKAVEALGEKILSTSAADTKPAAQPKKTKK